MGPVNMFCAPRLVFGGNRGVWTSFHFLFSRTCFGRYRGRRGPVLMFCAPGLVLCGTKGVRYHFYVLRSRNRLGTNQGRLIPFSSFALPNSFLAVPRASGPIFIFCALVLFLGGTEGVESRLEFFRSRTHFRWNRWRRVQFSYFALLDTFSAEPGASVTVFLFRAPEHGLGSIEGVVTRLHVLCSRTRFGRYRGCLVQFSCFTLSNSFGAVSRASRTVFTFCAPRHVSCGTEGVGYRF
jgi:hypothetical protein